MNRIYCGGDCLAAPIAITYQPQGGRAAADQLPAGVVEQQALQGAVGGGVKESAPDLVFRNATTHSTLQRLLLNNTSWQLIRRCPAPLWLVCEPDRLAAPPGGA